MAATTKNWVNNQSPQCEDVDLNGFKLENNNLIQGSGQSLSTADRQQTHKAVATYGAVGNYFQGGGSANAYTANAIAPRVNPPSRHEGMILYFQAPAANTGACALNAFNLGFVPIALRGGSGAIQPGDIKAGGLTMVIDRGAYFELVRSGKILDTVINFSVSNWQPQPDTAAIQFRGVGGGGGGGGIPAVTSSTAAAATGGGGGGFFDLLTTTIDSDYNIQIGVGGTPGGNGDDGGDGSDTSVTSPTLSATARGGKGGEGSSLQTAPGHNHIAGGVPGDAIGGSNNTQGSPGGRSLIVNAVVYNYSNGGGNFFGGGSQWASSSENQSITPGVGGHGAARYQINSTAISGAPGNKGRVLIREWF